MSTSRYFVDSYETLSPGVQVTSSAARPRIAAHVVSASTATPPSGWNPYGRVGAGSSTTRFTPGVARARVAS